MRNRLRLFVLMGGASVALGALFLVACSDDTSVDPKPTGDAGPDSPATDAPVDPDGGGKPDTGFDGGFKVETFDDDLASELCKALARCCYGNPTPADGGADGGTFDVAACKKQYGRLGFEGSNADVPITKSGAIALDQAKADACISKIKAMSCSLPGPEYESIAASCFSAYVGNVAANATCRASIECAAGSFCKGADNDGGTGVCAPLRPVGGPCGDFTNDPAVSGESCSYRRGGQPGNFCKFYDFTPPGVFLDPADWKCTAPLAVGGSCATSFWCDQSTCQNSVCATPDKYFAQSCQTFLVP